MTNDYLIKTNFRAQVSTVILSILIATIGSFVDGCVIGIYLGADNMAAYGYALPIVLLLFSALGGALSDGSAASCAVHIGGDNTEMANANFSAACLLSLVFGGIITILGVQFSEPIAVFLGARGHILQPTADFIRALSFGAFPAIFTQVLMAYNRLDGDAMLTVVSVILMTTVNIILDLVFVSKLNLGIYGIGVATSISYTAALLICLLHFFRSSNTLRLTKSQGVPLEVTNIVAVGFPTLLNGVCLSVRGLILNNLLFMAGGLTAVSALSVQNNVNLFLMPVIMGVGITLSIMAGIFYGEGDFGAIERVLRVSMKFGIAACVLLAAALYVIAPYAVELILGDGGEAGIIAVRALRFFSFSLPLALISVNLLYYYQTIKNFTMANAICICHGLVGPVLAALLFSRILSTDGIWLAFSTGEAVVLAGVVVRVKIKNRKWPVSLQDLLMLPAGLESENRHVLDLSISNNMSKVMELSRRISEFCRKYSNNEKKIGRLSLCVEEMVGNIVSHGFKHAGERFIDLRIIIEDDRFIFRIRDNGVSFNPLKYADLENTYGIKIVKGLAKSIDYRHTLGLNNLTIIL
ncbi:MAG: MATE family efflux transporter [Syntrophomonadaceae bacterium]|nr:MATE family efflux transporter [Syntrophomonadaceae bacterium]